MIWIGSGRQRAWGACQGCLWEAIAAGSTRAIRMQRLLEDGRCAVQSNAAMPRSGARGRRGTRRS
eukprot:1900606-Pyramimonas_sp.AAC.1